MERVLPVFTIEELEQQEELEFPSFSTEAAFDLGLIAGWLIRERELNLCVDIMIGDDLVFRTKLRDTGTGNNPWLAGKAAVVREFGCSSLLVKERHLFAGTPFESLDGIDHQALKAHGGSFPIRVNGELVGTITMSGEPDVIDHDTAVEAVRRFLRN